MAQRSAGLLATLRQALDEGSQAAREPAFLAFKNGPVIRKILTRSSPMVVKNRMPCRLIARSLLERARAYSIGRSVRLPG
jgi:hypothetical protein